MKSYIYKKTHNKTGLKYLGKTIDDPDEYKGSGTYWRRHIKKHGNDVTTEVLKECKTKAELKYWGTYYSKLWNVVDSKDWANIIPEQGEGGYTLYTKKHSTKISKARQGRKWFTNGSINVSQYTCPDGFWAGKSNLLAQPSEANEKRRKKLQDQWKNGRRDRKYMSQRMKGNQYALKHGLYVKIDSL